MITETMSTMRFFSGSVCVFLHEREKNRVEIVDVVHRSLDSIEQIGEDHGTDLTSPIRLEIDRRYERLYHTQILEAMDSRSVGSGVGELPRVGSSGG